MDPIIEAPNTVEPMPGVFSSGQPNPDQLRAAQARGLRTVVNLCAPHTQTFDERQLVESLGMTYVSIPVSNSGDLTEAAAGQLADVADAAARLPALVHCMSGNRVGALFAVKAFYKDGVSVEEALDIGRAAGMRGMEDAVREKLEAS